MKILSEFRNELLKRKEIVADMKSGKNPGIQGALKAVAEEFKAKEENIVLRKVDSQFGSDNFIITASIYDSPEARASVEPRPKVKKEKKL